MSSGKIFFSYSRKDSEFSLQLARELKVRGADVWMDQLDIQPGTTWDDAIEEALQSSEVLLVILSKTSVASKNVRDEYSFAIEEGKKVVPVLTEECSVPFRLRRLQYADFTGDSKIGMNTLMETLGLSTESETSELSETIKSNSSIKNKAGEKPRNRAYMVVGALILLALLYWVVTSILPEPDKASSQVTVLVHKENARDQIVLPNRGEVTLIFGDASVVETINSKGEATFKQIPKSFFDEGSTVEIRFRDPEGEPYRVLYPDSVYQLGEGNVIRLAVRLFGLDKVNGITRDFASGEPVDSVRVSISGIQVFSNAYGEFSMDIPEEAQKQFQTIRANKEGYESYDLSGVPIQTDAELEIMLKPKN